MSITLVKQFPVNAVADWLKDIDRALTIPNFASMAAPVVTPSVAGSTGYTYSVEPLYGTLSGPAGATTAITNGPSVLSSSQNKFNTITWLAVASATGYNIRRNASSGTPSTTGLVGLNVQIATGALSGIFIDNGIAGDGSSAPLYNNTGVIGAALQRPTQTVNASGTVAIGGFGLVAVTKSTAQAMSLFTPIAGSQAAGGHDGLSITIIDTTGHAHTVTTASNKINGNADTLTFAVSGTAKIGTMALLWAFNGLWWFDGLTNQGVVATAV